MQCCPWACSTTTNQGRSARAGGVRWARAPRVLSLGRAAGAVGATSQSVRAARSASFPHPHAGLTHQSTKESISKLLEEFLASGDAEEAARCLHALNVPFFHHEARALSLPLSLSPSLPLSLSLSLNHHSRPRSRLSRGGREGGRRDAAAPGDVCVCVWRLRPCGCRW